MSTWYPNAIRRDGPASKQGYPNYANRNAIAGVVLHGMDGFYATGGVNVLDNGATSWHFSILLDGTVYQHYPLEAQCWQSGNASYNRKTIGIEHEGVHSFRLDPLTEPQIAASVALCQWIAALPNAFTLVRGDTLFLHKDLGTSECPGVRFDGVIDRWLTPPADPNPVPAAYWNWRGKGDLPWQNVWELRITTIQRGTNVQLIREGRDGSDEVMRVIVEDWQ